MPSMPGLIACMAQLYEELMDDRNPLSFEQVQARLASPQTLEASIAALQESLALETRPKNGMRQRDSPWRASSSATPNSVLPIPAVWLNRAIDWLENEDLDWEEATARRLRRQKEIRLLTA